MFRARNLASRLEGLTSAVNLSPNPLNIVQLKDLFRQLHPSLFSMMRHVYYENMRERLFDNIYSPDNKKGWKLDKTN